MQAGGSIDLLRYWAVLRRRRWVVYLTVTAMTVVALVGSFLATPLYRATATVQIERQNPDILSFRDLAKVDYSWAAYQDFYQTQYKILASEAVALGAVKRVDLASHPLFTRADAKPSLLGRLRALFASGSGTRREQEDPSLAVAKAVQGGLEIAPIRNSHLVNVSWVSPDPALAAAVANAVAGAYIHFNIDLQYTSTDEAAEFLGNQIGNLRHEVAEIEERLQSYGESKQIVSIDDTNNITLQALSSISQHRTEAQTALAKAEAAYRAALASPPEALPEVLHSGLIDRLKEEYAGYEAQYYEKSRLFKADWPEMQTLSSKLEQARERLSLEIESIARQVVVAAEADYRKARREVGNLEDLLRHQQGAAQTLKRDAVEFESLQGEVQKKRETLNSLIARQNEMSLSTRLKDIAKTSSNIRIVDEARTPEAPFRPKRSLNLLLGAFLGVLLGVAGAFLLDHLDSSIHSADEIHSVAALPLLAVIPRHQGGAPTSLGRPRRSPAPADRPVDLIAHVDARSAVSEAYRELRTAILLSNPGHPPGRILVTSALPEEGKSTTAVNLAVVLAQLGRRVVLVDTDLRRARLHKIFRTDNTSGMSTFLSGLEPDPLRLARPTDVAHLELVPSGPVPPNPSELLNSAYFAAFGATYLERGYDHVVFDSPPALAVSDAVIISSMVDAVVLVARAGRTPRQSLRLVVDKLTQAGCRPVGVVLNDLDVRSGPGTSYRYYGTYAHSAEATEPTPKKTRAGAG